VQPEALSRSWPHNRLRTRQTFDSAIEGSKPKYSTDTNESGTVGGSQKPEKVILMKQEVRTKVKQGQGPWPGSVMTRFSNLTLASPLA
jgi:hypothetical protein